jgi:glycosyltransferase involved in cell wall biosynthesis
VRSVLIYYPFTLEKRADSGSKLRPLEMVRAFKKWGKLKDYQIYIISGNSEERTKQFQRLKQKHLLENLAFCYVENQTIPIWLTDPNHIPKNPFIEHQVFRYLQQKNIPVGVFYRDVYWKFDQLYPLKGWKKRVMHKIYRYEERFLAKYADVIFLPSLQMSRFVHIPITKKALPPGGRTLSTPIVKNIEDGIKAIYVGGILHPDYGLSLMLDTLEKIKKQGLSLQLSIVCRTEEFQQLNPVQKEWLKYAKVQIRHLSEKELDEYYKEMHFAIIPRYRSTYNDFSVPVKLVEYLCNRLPVVVTDCLAQRELVESGPYGEICTADSTSMASAFVNMSKNRKIYEQHIDQDFLQKHSWMIRVETVAASLRKGYKR